MINEKLIHLRKEKRFSQLDMAKHLKISQPQYLRKEKGLTKVSSDEWERMAKLLNVDIDKIKQTNVENYTDQTFMKDNNVVKNCIGIERFCSIPEYILQNQQDYIEILKKEIADLKMKITELEKK